MFGGVEYVGEDGECGGKECCVVEVCYCMEGDELVYVVVEEVV